jgi:lipoprotein-releasing system permease protein
LDFRLKIALRMLMRRRGSLLASTVAVSIAVLVIVINFVTFDGVANAVVRDLVQYRFGHVLVTDRDGNIQKPDAEMIGFLTNLGYVEGATTRLLEFASVNNTRNAVPIRAYGVSVVGVIPEQEVHASKIHNTVVQGIFLNSKDGAVLGASLADDLDATVGDPIAIKVAARDGSEVVKRFKVTGISETPGGLGFDTSVIVDIESLREMTGRINESSQLIIRLYDTQDVDRAIHDIMTRYPTERFEAETVEESGRGILQGIRSGIAFINLVGYFGMLSSAFGIITIMIMIVTSKTREIGVIRAIGSNKRDIMAVFILQGLFIGSMGAAMGFVMGSAYSLYADLADLSFGGSLVLEVKYDPVFVGFTAATGLLMSVAASVYPAWRTTKLEPAEATRY